MKSLYSVIRESILDDDFVASISTTAWLEKYLSEGSYKMTNDGVVQITGSHVFLTIENDDIPEGLKFDGQYSLTLKSCANVDMNAFQGSIVYATFEDCDFKRFEGKMGQLTSKYTFRNCVGTNTKWMGEECLDVILENCSGVWDFTKFNTDNVVITVHNSDCAIRAKRVHTMNIRVSKLQDIFKGIDIDYKIININDCKAIKNLKGINPAVELVYINNCPNLESLEGLENTEAYSFSFSGCPKLDNSDYLPTTLQSIVAHGDHLCWTENEIAQKYPYISSIHGTPLHAIDPTLGGTVKVGAYGAVRSAAHSSSFRFGSSRGSLVLDRIKKIGKTVIWEKCKSRSYDDFEMMNDEANPKKNWDYVDPNGFNDCTGVGIEVGDEVVVYCASGSFGRSNGVSLDTVIGFTPKMVKTKNNGNRPTCDICILRPHRIAKDFFEK